MNDIDLGGSAKGQWDPIGTNGNAFTGTFDGNYHVIRGLYINRSSDYQGLFGLNCGTIRDLTVQGTVTGGQLCRRHCRRFHCKIVGHGHVVSC